MWHDARTLQKQRGLRLGIARIGAKTTRLMPRLPGCGVDAGSRRRREPGIRGGHRLRNIDRQDVSRCSAARFAGAMVFTTVRNLILLVVSILRSGSIDAEVIYTPGHTPACVSYKIGDAVFIGDTMFMPDYGTARADFPGGNARDLYRSIQRILSLPPQTRLFMCHDYKAPGRDQYAWETTVAEEQTRNVHVHGALRRKSL